MTLRGTRMKKEFIRATWVTLRSIPTRVTKKGCHEGILGSGCVGFRGWGLTWRRQASGRAFWASGFKASVLWSEGLEFRTLGSGPSGG